MKSVPIFVTIRAKQARPQMMPQFGDIAETVLREKADDHDIILHAFCIMPDHMHIVCSVDDDGDFKKYVTILKSEISRRMHTNGFDQFEWQRSYWDRHARREDDLRELIEYVLDNPVRKDLCRKREEWRWSELVSWPGK
ncbi:MAG: transposase [Armatimonadota bacterium]